MQYLTQPQLEQFFSVISTPRERALFRVIYFYGLRATEPSLLRLETDINLDRKTIYIHRLKGGMSGEKPLGTRIIKALKEYLPVRQSTGEALFTGRQGNLKRHRIAQLFKHSAHRSGLDAFSVHCLRHSIATHMRDAGFELDEIKEHLGHRSINSTLIYTRITDSRLREVYKRLETSPRIVHL